jgi:two-component system phosphate regulon sensor histidine kinase PhoR
MPSIAGKSRSCSLAERDCGIGYRIDVEDTGGGVPARELARVFERFYRIDKSRMRDRGGTGLGLAIAKHAIESQGGTLTVSSRPGTVSTFTIMLPAP